MKDYSREITKIILSGVKIDFESGDVKVSVSQLLKVSPVVQKINSLIQNEIVRLEEEIISLTEQLFESESLLTDARKKSSDRVSETGLKARRTRYIHH